MTRTVITDNGDGRGSPMAKWYTWVPIPEDRDQAFIDLDGFAMTTARRGVPRFITQFEDKYTNLLGSDEYGFGTRS